MCMGLKLRNRRHLPAVIARPLTSVKVLLATLLSVLASDTIAYFRPHH